MCGITYIEKGKEAESRIALSLLKHRGPDEQNFKVDSHGTICSTRLAIVDKFSGKQPMKSKGGKYTIVFNGEIYNYKELKKKLEEKGHQFQTSSDTEVILNAYIEYKEETPKRLIGQFAFIILDNKTGDIFASRDHFGLRPLYFGKGNTGIILASEISVLLENGVKGKDLRKIPQGCMLNYSPKNKKIILKRYYDLRENLNKKKANPKELFNLLKKSVKKRIPKEVNYATIVSGIDSSAITFLVNQASKKPEIAYTIATSPESKDVTSNKILSSELGIKGKIGYIDEEYILNKIPEVIRATASPEYFLIINTFPTFKLAEMLKKEKIKVVLTGSGSDEINLGYDYLWELCNPKHIKENFLSLVLSYGEHEALREDRIFSARGIESRCPFMDKEVVEYVLSTPFEKRLPKKDLKFLKNQLKLAMKGKLPDKITFRKKEALYRSTGMISLVSKVADKLMSDKEYKEYFNSVKNPYWKERMKFYGKPLAVFHREWAKQFPELAKVKIPLSPNIPNQDNLEELSKFKVAAGGGVYVNGWNGKIK